MKKYTTQAQSHDACVGDLPRSPFLFLLATVRPYWRMAVVALLVTAITQSLGASISFIVGRFVDAVTQTSVLAEQLAAMRYWGALFFIYSVILYSGWRLTGMLVARVVTRQNTNAYTLLMSYVTKHSHTYYINRFAGSVSNKVANAGDGSARLLEILFADVLQQSVLLLVLGAVVLTVNGWLALIFYFFVFLSVVINYRLVRWRRPNVVALSALSSKLRGQIVDLFGNVQAARQYVRVNDELDRVGVTLRERAAIDLRQWQQGEMVNTMSNMMALAMTSLLLFGTYLFAERGFATMGGMVVIMIVSFRVAGALAQIGGMMNRIIRVYGEVEEGLRDILVPYEIIDSTNATKLEVKNGGEVVWHDVTFEYGENKVFNHFNLRISPGQRVGLVGSSGAGKTTFVSLLLRQHEITDGVIAIDGQDIKTVTQNSLRSAIAVVPQEPLLFHRTIRENIAYGKPAATIDEIIAVAIKAHAHDFITALPEGYDTLVGERGVKLSGGQKQRVAIARAMLKDAPILLLDEATSALDSESEVAIQQALHVLMEGKTVVAIAHRLSTLREMDRIIVLEQGTIIEDGTHETLAKAGGTYERLWTHQAGGFLVE